MNSTKTSRFFHVVVSLVALADLRGGRVCVEDWPQDGNDNTMMPRCPITGSWSTCVEAKCNRWNLRFRRPLQKSKVLANRFAKSGFFEKIERSFPSVFGNRGFCRDL